MIIELNDSIQKPQVVTQTQAPAKVQTQTQTSAKPLNTAVTKPQSKVNTGNTANAQTKLSSQVPISHKLQLLLRQIIRFRTNQLMEVRLQQTLSLRPTVRFYSLLFKTIQLRNRLLRKAIQLVKQRKIL